MCVVKIAFSVFSIFLFFKNFFLNFLFDFVAAVPHSFCFIFFVLFSSVFLFYFFHLFLVSFIFKFRIYQSYTATNQPTTSCLIVDENFKTHVDFHKFSILCESISLAVLYKFLFCVLCSHIKEK